jgi:hypothetical protein
MDTDTGSIDLNIESDNQEYDKNKNNNKDKMEQTINNNNSTTKLQTNMTNHNTIQSSSNNSIVTINSNNTNNDTTNINTNNNNNNNNYYKHNKDINNINDIDCPISIIKTHTTNDTSKSYITTEPTQLSSLQNTNRIAENTTPQDNINMEENNIIDKYIHQIDLLTPEYINKLPIQDQVILNKILDNENKTFPQEEPFTIVQSKSKVKHIATETDKNQYLSTHDSKQTQFINEKYMKKVPTTPIKDKQIKAPLIYDPDYTFGAQITQTNINIDTPQINATENTAKITTSLRPHGGRFMQGRGGGVGGRSAFIMKTVYNTKTRTSTKQHQTNHRDYKINNHNYTIDEDDDNTKYNEEPSNIYNKESVYNTTTTNDNMESENEDTSKTLQSTRNPNTVTFQPIEKKQLDHTYTFCVYISTKQTDNKEDMSRQEITEHILKSLQAVCPTIKLLSIPNPYYQQLSTSSMYDDKIQLTKQHSRYISDLFTTPKGAITGNLWFNSPTIYSSLKREATFRQHLSLKYNIYITANRLNTTKPTEIGYFIHRLVRHDTVEDTTYTRSFLPQNTPPFQQDQTSIWASTSNIKRSTGVVTISTRPEDAKEMITILEKSFKNPNNMTFISKIYFNSLDNIQRLQHVESQIQYTKTHRSIIFRNNKETHVPTKYDKPNTTSKLLLPEWITQIKDYQGRSIYLQVFPPVNNLIEAHILTSNVWLAYEWERESIAHIAQAIDKQEYNKVFDLPIEEQNKIIPSPDTWQLNPAPEINFLVPQRKAAWKSQIPQTIQNEDNQSTVSDNKSHSSSTSKQKRIKHHQTDANTVVTTTTFNSESNDLISDLQDESRQHLEYIEEHRQRISILETQIQELREIQSWSTRISRLENQSSNFNTELKNISTNIIPTITSTLKRQSLISSQIIEDTSSNQVQQAEQNRETNRRLNAQQQCIDNLNIMITTILNSTKNQEESPYVRPRKKPHNQQNQQIQSTTQPNMQTDTYMQADTEDTTHTIINRQNEIISLQIHSNNQTQDNTIESQNINDSSPYSSVFLSRDMIVLSPINNTSPTRHGHDVNERQNTIDLTTQSPTTQNDSAIMLPRNLSNSFPTPMQEASNKNNEDLGNHHPGNDT